MLPGWQFYGRVYIKLPNLIQFQEHDDQANSYTVGLRQSKSVLFDWTFFEWIILVLLLIISRANFVVFVLFLETVRVREYCRKAVENRLVAQCFARSPRATRASRATNPRPSGLAALGLAESRQSYVRGVALSREQPKL